MKIKAYFKEYLHAENFFSQGIKLQQHEYDSEVVKNYSNPIVQNEIHGLVNEYAMKVIQYSRDGKTKDVDRALGSIEVLERLLLKGEKTRKKVSVIE